MMAHRTISLQPPSRSNTTKTVPGEETQGCRQKLARFMSTARLLRAHAPLGECRSRGESTMDRMR
jgi:hypothetical protein